MQLLLGCGHDRMKKLWPPGSAEWRGLVTVDVNPLLRPDVVWDLNARPLPFEDDSAEEIHAYDVLEHVDRQGCFLGFFALFEDFWRILKPGGYAMFTVPRHDSVWAWGDPGHTRVLPPETFFFLSQAAYIEECRPGGTNRTDYRNVYRGDFDVVLSEPYGSECHAIALRAVKPSRWVAP